MSLYEDSWHEAAGSVCIIIIRRTFRHPQAVANSAQLKRFFSMEGLTGSTIKIYHRNKGIVF